MTMTPKQFDALAKLANMSPDCRTHTACRMHFVGGHTRVHAARETGILLQGVSNACTRIEKAQERLPDLLATVQAAMGVEA